MGGRYSAIVEEKLQKPTWGNRGMPTRGQKFDTLAHLGHTFCFWLFFLGLSETSKNQVKGTVLDGAKGWEGFTDLFIF